MYKPLPEMVTIKDSGIHGLGLFATADISSGTILGMIHFEFHDQTLRTPLGAFGHHSDDPTCEKLWEARPAEGGAGWYLRTKRNVTTGEELTLKQTMYNVT